MEVLLNHLSVMMEGAQTQRFPVVQKMMLPYLTKPFKSYLPLLIDCMQQPNVSVVDIVHKTISYNLFNYLNISIINEICKKIAHLFCIIFSL